MDLEVFVAVFFFGFGLGFDFDLLLRLTFLCGFAAVVAAARRRFADRRELVRMDAIIYYSMIFQHKILTRFI